MRIEISFFQKIKDKIKEKEQSSKSVLRATPAEAANIIFQQLSTAPEWEQWRKSLQQDTVHPDLFYPESYAASILFGNSVLSPKLIRYRLEQYFKIKLISPQRFQSDSELSYDLVKNLTTLIGKYFEELPKPSYSQESL